MKKILLDCGLLSSKASAHQVLLEAFDFPDYYGRNLDALFDLLSCWEPAEVRFCHPERLGAYGERILQVFFDAAQENPGLRICVGPREGRPA